MRITPIGLLLLASVSGCGHSDSSSPFVSVRDAEAERSTITPVVPDSGGTVIADAGEIDAGNAAEWGGPCLDDGECDDTIACTHDVCDPIRGHCHFSPDDAACDDGIYCDGIERCLSGIGCRPGDAVSCSDGTACTIDACVEATHQCTHTVRDADGDGDPDGNCPGGGDCDDANPNVSSKAKEICGNGIDDNCNGQIDEQPCVSPLYDSCAGPLVVTAPGTFVVSPVGASLDYSASCAATNPRTKVLVVTIDVPEGAVTDVDLVAAGSGNLALAAVTRCEDPSSEFACGSGSEAAGVARLRLRGLSPGSYSVYLFTDSAASVTLSVDYVAPESAPTNETCGTALPLTPGVHADADLTSALPDLATACGPIYGDLVYTFTLTAPSDVRLFATAKDDYGVPVLSLRGGTCGEEIDCHTSANAMLFERALPAGQYFVDVGSTGPSDTDVLLETAPPTSPPADENCVGSPTLPPDTTMVVDLADHVDDIQLGCSVGTPDAAYALTLTSASDVLVIQTVADSDQGWVSLADAACSLPLLACASSDSTLARATARDVPAGSYRVIDETTLADPTTVTAFVRLPAPTTLVPFSDACATATEIPSIGGLFEGNTANATDDFTASCDVGGVGGSPDQMLHLHLASTRRVVLSGEGSAYSAIIDVRSGTTCPGTEVVGGCSAGYVRDGPYVDMTLSPGDYWIQVDGYDQSSGAWKLDAYVVSP